MFLGNLYINKKLKIKNLTIVKTKHIYKLDYIQQTTDMTSILCSRKHLELVHF